MKPKRITNREIILQFQKAIAVMEVKNANRFRIRAYQNALDTIKLLDEELESIYKRGALEQISGIGKDLSAKISDLINTGHTAEWDKLFNSVPQGMFALLDIPGVGPKRAYQLTKALNLNNPKTALTGVKNAAQKGKIKDLEGFGEKLEQEILSNIDKQKPKTNRQRLDEADVLANKIIYILNQIKHVETVSILGSLRRREETVGDIDIAVATKFPGKVLEILRKQKEVNAIKAAGNNVVRLIFNGNKQADIKFQTPDRWGATLQHFTGSKYHNIALREYSLNKNLSLSEHGIKKGNKLLKFYNEQSFYSYLGLDYIPPVLRQNTGEIEAAAAHNLPKLIELSDIKGDFHTHTSYGWISSHDYGQEIEHLFETAHKLGYEWLAIGDHNPSRTSYSSDDLKSLIKDRNQYIKDRLDAWQQKTQKPIKILNTLEIDILPDGSLAIPDAAIDELDFAIVSVHSRFNLSLKEQTNRVLKALKNPKVKILGHPSGRLINRRHGIEIDWNRVMEYCANCNIAMEINAQPVRLDLPDSLSRKAIELKVKLSIGTDAHLASDLRLMPFGIDVAKRAWATKRDIINSKSYIQIKAWLKI